MITNILDANKEIDRLNAALVQANSEKVTLAEALHKTSEKLSILSPEALAKLQAENNELAAKVVDLEKANNDLSASIAGKVEAEASKRAQEIVASVGVRAANTAGANGNSEEIISRLNAITHPVQRAEFFKANKAAINSAFSQSQPRKN